MPLKRQVRTSKDLYAKKSISFIFLALNLWLI